ncbi:unnamed protein product [Mycena citricolor]|uniref:Ubiquitin-like domain-containing protein n=1 Tax=Mycena citricolor TaxID=2018698 RepID=A0AAD2HN22_9AGAR|nr:unnamed protein product [Mycena citricolor]
MVHRPADSRLLSNLLSQEKEYAKHLTTLLDHSNASLASVTAYAAASSPASAHLILAVSAQLASADEALRHYAVAVGRWQEYLKNLKGLEDEVGNIMRDREILVTRLIKASKLSPHPSLSSSSLVLSASQSHTSLPSVNSKLAAAQTELQACEAHLASKEAELDVHRAALVREGLADRCRALAECGQQWSEAGRIGALTAQGGPHPRLPSPVSDVNKPLPGVSGSDVSLAPSQSASQIQLFPEPQQHIYSNAGLPPPSAEGSSSSGIAFPAAHALHDSSAPVLPFAHRTLPRRITEEDLLRTAEENSSEDEPVSPAQLEIVENPRFANNAKVKAGPSRKDSFLRRQSLRSTSTMSVPAPSKSSSGFFGSIRGLFGGRKGGSDVAAASAVPAKRRGKLRELSEEDDARGEVLSEPRPRVLSEGSVRRKGSAVNKTAVLRAEEWVGGQGLMPLPRRAEVEDRGWASDGPSSEVVLVRKKSKKRDRTAVSSVSADGDSVVPPRTHKRRVSLDVTAAGGSPQAIALMPAGSIRKERRASMPVHSAPRAQTDIPSLMSIVEGVAQANREGWAAYNDASTGLSSSAPVPSSSIDVPRSNGQNSRGRTGLPAMTSNLMQIDGLPRAPGSVFATAYPQAPASNSLSNPASAASSPASSIRRPAKSPLRSALRNASPAPVVPPLPAAVAPSFPIIVKAPAPITVTIPVLNLEGSKTVVPVVTADGGDSDDGASISSYETGHETFSDGDEDKSPPLPPNKESATMFDSPINGNGNIEAYGRGSDVSASSTSTQMQGPQRRKSVRVSLQPTFSTTPPAIDDDDDDDAGSEGRHPPWERSATPDMWADSSEEDSEYQTARKLLTRVARKKNKKSRVLSSLVYSISDNEWLLRLLFVECDDVSQIADPPSFLLFHFVLAPSSITRNRFSHLQHTEMAEEDQQGTQEVKSEDAQSTINIKVVSSTGEEVFFKIKRSTKLSKLQGAYANKVGKDVGSIRFLYDGSRISDDDTPATLDMEDNDTIDVMVEQVGGRASRR